MSNTKTALTAILLLIPFSAQAGSAVFGPYVQSLFNKLDNSRSATFSCPTQLSRSGAPLSCQAQGVAITTGADPEIAGPALTPTTALMSVAAGSQADCVARQIAQLDAALGEAGPQFRSMFSSITVKLMIAPQDTGLGSGQGLLRLLPDADNESDSGLAKVYEVHPIFYPGQPANKQCHVLSKQRIVQEWVAWAPKSSTESTESGARAQRALDPAGEGFTSGSAYQSGSGQ
jgi:hypothetical protein